jgi:hypothetical protein
MRHFLKIADGVDVLPLMTAIDGKPELWDAHSERKTSAGSPHSRMSDIWVRYNDKARYKDRESFNAEHVPAWYPAWHALPGMRRIIFDLMAAVDGEMLGGVLITRIPPGGGIAPHVDTGWHVEYYDKFYVSLRSAPGAEFLCDDGGEVEALNPKEGEIWRFDNRKNHWVENRSDRDRITLIVCIRTAKYKDQS